MTDNPVFVLIGLCLCWPGLIPLIAVAILSRRYNFRNPFVPRNIESQEI